MPLSKAFYQSNLTLINKVYYLKNYWVPKKCADVFLKVIGYIFKILKQKLTSFLSWSSWTSNKDILFEYFPLSNLHNTNHYKLWNWYEMKAWLFYICLTYSIFSRGLGISSKSGKYSPYLNYSKGCLSP